MWLITWRDLMWRRRRFAIAVLATSIVFAMTLLLSGVGASLHRQDRHIVSALGAERWLVAAGASGPFTANLLVPEAVADAAARTPGVTASGPLVIFRSTVGTTTLKDVNLLGYRPGALGTPPVSEGRPATAAGEVVADAVLGKHPGAQLQVGGRPFRVVGVSHDITFYFGTPTVLMTLGDAQALAFAGQPYVSAVALAGSPSPGALPPGVRLVSNAEARADLRRPTKSGDQSIAFINALLWVVAAGIIGSIVYLSTLERTRDFAVMRATGASTGALAGGLAAQSLLLALTAAVLSAGVAQILAPAFPFSVTIPAGGYLGLVVVACGVGLMACLLGLRRAVGVDPALAFGGA